MIVDFLFLQLDEKYKVSYRLIVIIIVVYLEKTSNKIFE